VASVGDMGAGLGMLVVETIAKIPLNRLFASGCVHGAESGAAACGAGSRRSCPGMVGSGHGIPAAMVEIGHFIYPHELDDA